MFIKSFKWLILVLVVFAVMVGAWFVHANGQPVEQEFSGKFVKGATYGHLYQT